MITLTKGTKVRDYILLERLSQTNMGQVWKAQDSMRQRIVAVKMLHNDLVDDEEFRDRFMDEIKRHTQLEHPHIVPVYDFFAEENLMCMVMRFIEGPSLSQAIAKHPGPLPLNRVIRISVDVLGALDYAHRQGIIHRDVKPSNIVLDSEDNAHLIDFGIALAIGDIRRTRVGGTVGTPLYMSPEQVRSPKRVDQRTDVYSYGCVLYEMLTKRAPFRPKPDEDPEFSVRQAHLTETPARPKEINPALPTQLDEIVVFALTKNPDDRIPGCGEFRRLLQEFRPDEKTEQIASVRLPKAVWLVPLLLAGITLLVVLAEGMSSDRFGIGLLITTLVHLTMLVITVNRGWKAIEDGQSRVRGRDAAGFLFIPFFNIYWYLKVVTGYPKAYNSYLDRHHLGLPRLGSAQFWLYVVSGFFALASIFWQRESEAQFLLWLVWSFAGVIVMAKVAGAVNRLGSV